MTGPTGPSGATGATGPTGSAILATPATQTQTGAAGDNDVVYGPPDTGTNATVTLTTGTRALVIVTGRVAPPFG